MKRDAASGKGRNTLVQRVQDFVNRYRFSSLQKAEARIAGKTQGETAVVFDAQGNYVFSRTSPTRRIEFSDAEAVLMRDAVVTHNHPGGTPFGDTDIQTACVAQVREMRVVTSKYIFSMRPPARGWDAAFWEQTVNPARLKAEVAAAQSLYPVQDTMDSETYNFELLDHTWEAVAKNTGSVYNKHRR